MTSASNKLTLILYPEELTVYRLTKDAKIPNKTLEQKWFTISKTLEELSIIVPSECKLLDTPSEDVKEEGGWRVMKIDGTLDFSLVGILASIISPLKDVGIPVFVVSTYDTDYILVKAENLESARKTIIEYCGHDIVNSKETLI